MRLRTHHKLFLSYTLLVGAVVLILVVGVDATLREPLLERARVDLLRELALGRDLYDARPTETPDAIARHMRDAVGHRVTIIAPDGNVLGESDVPPDMVPHLENHGQRSEVLQARTTGTGTSIRRSASVAEDLLYAATVTRRGDVIRFAVDIRQVDAAIGRVRRQILIVGAIALLLAVAFSYGFSFAGTRRLRRMQRVALAMAGGDLDARVRDHHTDELGELGLSLDTLAEQLQRRLDQLEGEREEMQALIDAMAEGVLAVGPDGSLRRANPAARRMFDLPPGGEGTPPEAIARRRPFLDLVRRVLDREAVPATELTYDGQHLLATAQPLPRGGAVLVFLDTSEVRRLEGVRRDFVANASHELKTPLTAIRGYAETLLDDQLPPELRGRFTRTIHTHAARLQNILDDLLDLSRIESGGLTLNPEAVALDTLARDAWEPFADSAAQRDTHLELDLDEDSRTVHVDPGALRQILSNLLSNATRYTPDGGRITVWARRDEAAAGGPATPPMVRIEVRDTGTGIPREHLDRIFERFYRVDPARSRAEGGTGLGLAIVRHLVERHGGRVEAESELGRGTTIRFTLPAARGRN
jgi:two-component system, OmpR family, phosphate regulon sensor histidine kinase PhoR